MRKLLPCLVAVPALLGFSLALQAQTASLVRDLGSGSSSWSGTVPAAFYLLATPDKVLFIAGYPVYEVAVADGAGTGSEILADLCPGSCASMTALVGRVGNVALFYSIGSAAALYRTDGTRAGTYALGGGGPIPQIAGTLAVALAGDLAYFVRATAAGYELWATDGTVPGTRQLPWAASAPPAEMKAVGRRLFFLAGDELWTSDGTAAGTRALRSFAGQSPHSLTPGASVVYLAAVTADSWTLWRSDGTADGTQLAASLPVPRSARLLATSGDQLYLTLDDAAHGEELWTSTGTQQGTHAITDLADPAPFGSSSPLLAPLDGPVVFRANGGTWVTTGDPLSTTLLTPREPFPQTSFVRAGRRALFVSQQGSRFELWATDGTVAHTGPVPLACTGCQVRPQLVPFQGGALFQVTDSRGTAVWTTDGTPAGTHAVSDPIPGQVSLFQVAAVGRRIFFLASTGAQGGDLTLWTSDSRPGDTHAVPGFPTSRGGAALADFAAAGGKLLFTACDDSFNRQIWESDGTAAGTVPKTSLPPSLASCGYPSRGFTPLGDRIFFWLADPATRDGNGASAWLLWVRDGAGTTRQLTTVPYASGVFDPPRLVPFGSEVFFAISQGALWRSDGTPAGTRPAAELAAISSPKPIATAGGLLFLTGAGADPVTEREIWASDGTAAGTRRLLSSPSFLLSGLYPAGPASFFFLYRPDNVTELWRTDATAAGTVRVAVLPEGPTLGVDPPTVLGGVLYFFTSGSAGKSLYRADASGAAPVRTFALPVDLPSQRLSAFPVVFGGRLFFFADDGVHGRALWASDGTAAGTVPIHVPGPTPGSRELGQLTAAGGKLYFTAWDQAHGVELWVSDGTAAGTRLAADIAPQAASSSPGLLTVAGDRLYFTADDGVTGTQLWSLPLAGPAGCQPSGTRLCLAAARFRVEIAWRDFQGHAGVGHAVALTPDTGYFWFFDPANAEVVVKMLDARALNQAFWVFYGALSTVEYEITVTDTETGLSRRYYNPPGQLASAGDTAGFGPLGAYDSKQARIAAPAAALKIADRPRAATGSCAPGPRRLCLQGGRFAVEAAWKDFQGKTGAGTAVPLSGDTGYFWFFAPTNVEVLAKVLDGRGLNGKFWFFDGALSNVEYTLTVTDTQTGAVKTYHNSAGQFGSLADTGAF